MKKIFITLLIVIIVYIVLNIDSRYLHFIPDLYSTLLSTVPLVILIYKWIEENNKNKKLEIIEKRRNQEFEADLKNLLKRIEYERPNFILLQSPNLVFKNSNHEKAVKITSFELLANELNKFSKHNFYKRTINKALKETKKNMSMSIKHTNKLLELLDKIEKRLK